MAGCVGLIDVLSVDGEVHEEVHHEETRCQSANRIATIPMRILYPPIATARSLGVHSFRSASVIVRGLGSSSTAAGGPSSFCEVRAIVDSGESFLGREEKKCKIQGHPAAVSIATGAFHIGPPAANRARNRLSAPIQSAPVWSLEIFPPGIIAMSRLTCT